MKKMKPYPWTFIQADIDGPAKLDVSTFRKFESSKFRRQEIAIHGIKVFEQVRIDGTPKNFIYHQLVINYCNIFSIV